MLGCRKWGCNKWGLKGCLAALPRNRPFSPFFCLFRPFPEGAKSTWKIQKTEEKGLFPQISSDFLKPPSLKRPFAAPRVLFSFFRSFFAFPCRVCILLLFSSFQENLVSSANFQAVAVDCPSAFGYWENCKKTAKKRRISLRHRLPRSKN